jgi:hypothetical protein
MRLWLQNKVVAHLLILSLLWILMVVLANPSGDFPLNDDWSYGKTVKRLVEDGVFQPTGWTTMPLLTHTLWGALFCLPFGFSFIALRFSTLILAWVGILGTYLLLKQVRAPHSLAFMAALIVAVNPIYFALSHTFMTDVPFTTFTILALLFLTRPLQIESGLHLALGIFFATAAVLCRQLGLVVPIAFALTYLIKKGLSLPALLRAGLPVVIGLSALLGFEHWLKISTGLSPMYGREILSDRTPENIIDLLSVVAGNGLQTLVYLGLFLLPLMLLLPHFFKGMENRVARFSAIIFVIAATLAIFLPGQFMPLSRNILTVGGIGPVTLRDVYLLGLPHEPALSLVFWIPLTVIGILSGALILAWVIFLTRQTIINSSHLKDSDNRIVAVFLLSAYLIYAGFIIAFHSFFDRYLLPLIPLLCATITGSIGAFRFHPRPVVIGLAALLICLYSFFSITATRDYLTWHRIRWEALRVLVEIEHIPPSKIDGGFEFNGWYLYDLDYSPAADKSWWWVHDDDYMVTMGPVAGYKVVKQYPFKRWLPPQKATIFVLRRENPL